MSWMGAGDMSYGGGGDKSLKMNLADTFRLAWADPELRARLKFVFFIFAVYALGVNIPVPIPGVNTAQLESMMDSNQFLQLMSMMGGGAIKKISIFALGLTPYITASIIMQVLQAAYPQFKQEMKEGGQYARQKMGRRTRFLSIGLSLFQGWGIFQMFKQLGVVPSGAPATTGLVVVIFWMAGSMLMLWLGEQVSEKGIGNGVSLLIFCGIIISFPQIVKVISGAVAGGSTSWFSVILTAALFFAVVWFIVYFTIAQRRIPIQHMRRQLGTQQMGGQTSYLPFSLNMVGVMPIIFAVSLIYMPAQFATMFGPTSTVGSFFEKLSRFLSPNFTTWQGFIGAFAYILLIFFFTYFYTAIQFNVDDIADNLKRGGSFIPGIRPGKQTRDFLDKVISRVTIVGAGFLALVALTQYVIPLFMNVQSINMVFGTSLLIMVSVALETMRQIEANLLMKQYGAG